MILPIAVYGHPVLRQVAKAVGPEYPNLQQFIKDLWATMYRTDGIGLAAPQVAKSIRMFVIDLDVFKDDYPELKGFKKVFINPQIEFPGSKKVKLSEGCLSLPGIHKKVKRPDRIRIHYQDEAFNNITEEYSGFAARVIQHEYDHLEGKLFIDELNWLTKAMLKRQLLNLQNGKVNADYRTLSV
ncbi:peptide deformylase [Carboxylicivirga mesophila]|uniref:Peptide deformylase n=1 Tax=Carboxylicivirga mesophila TaxID=1166478 RepID=A0ABS5K901_9BACT|nr:peptide deformylase [Carboxylicivirga mesophila]MBS2211484.1 peptide deformylase [Carboxylicivirga mesophila]